MRASGEIIVKSACRMCHGVCGVLVHIQDGKVVKITGDPTSPISHGYICPKGRASPELLYHPERLKYPLKRQGAKGDNKWQRISWDEALDTIAQELMNIKHKFGAESIVRVTGTGRQYAPLFRRFFNCLGTPNVLSITHNCYIPRQVASIMTCGKFPICDYYGFGGIYPKCVLNWGCNIVESASSDGMCAYQLTRTIRNGAKLIVIDPRKTSLANKASQWLQIRPGTDDALALGMLNVIIKEELYDRDFVHNWTVGFDELAERVEAYTPEVVSNITWIPEASIISAARTYATTKPACIQWGNALDQNINSFQTLRAVFCLSAITGNLDVPGGDVFWVPPDDVIVQAFHIDPGITLPEKITPEIRSKRIGTGTFKVLDHYPIHPRFFLDAVFSKKPYPVKALFIMGSNMLLTQSDPLMMAKAMREIDFTVAVDLFMTPTAQLADIVLPAASWLEMDDVADMHFGWCVMLRQKVAEIAECRSDNQILIDLAHRMGLSKDFPWKNVREYCDWLLKGTGLTFEEFKHVGILEGKMRYKKYEQEGFNTPSGKVELKCSKLESMGYDGLPYVVEPQESPYSTPDLLQDYPLIITTGSRIKSYFCSEGRQIGSLRKLNPDPVVEIHPETASSLNIKNGDWVSIKSLRGSIRQRAKLTDGIHPKVVHAQHGWWFPEKEPPEYGYLESNVNILTGNMPLDPHTGAESFRSFLCKVEKLSSDP